MKDQIEVKQASVKDAEVILQLQMRYLSEDEIYNEHGPPLTQSLNEIKQEFSQQVFLKGYIQKERDEEEKEKGDRSYKIENIVGSVRGYLEKGTAYIGRLIVKPEYQNKGIRTRLMQAIEQYFKFASCYELFITGHKSARNLYSYQNLGYHEFKRISVDDSLTYFRLYSTLSLQVLI